MISEQELNEYIRQITEKIIDDTKAYDVIIAEQNAPRPNIPYCTVHIMNIMPVMLEDFETVDEGENVIITSKSLSKVFVSFKFYKSMTIQQASLVRQGLARDSIQSLLQSFGLGLADRSVVRNETAKLENGFEDRAGFDAYFHLVVEDKDTVGTINTAEASGEYQSNGKSYPIEFEL